MPSVNPLTVNVGVALDVYKLSGDSMRQMRKAVSTSSSGSSNWQVRRGDYVLANLQMYCATGGLYLPTLLFWYPSGYLTLLSEDFSDNQEPLVNFEISSNDYFKHGWHGDDFVGSNSTIVSASANLVNKDGTNAAADRNSVFSYLTSSGLYASDYFNGKDGVFCTLLSNQQGVYIPANGEPLIGGAWFQVKNDAPLNVAFPGFEIVPNSIATNLQPERAKGSICNIARVVNNEMVTSEFYDLTISSDSHTPSNGFTVVSEYSS